MRWSVIIYSCFCLNYLQDAVVNIVVRHCRNANIVFISAKNSLIIACYQHTDSVQVNPVMFSILVQKVKVATI